MLLNKGEKWLLLLLLLLRENRRSEAQPGFPRCICKGLHTPVVPEAAAIKGHLQ
jgi:hypothetical protein